MKKIGALLLGVTLAISACGSDQDIGLAGQVRTPAPIIGTVSLPEVTSGTPRDFPFRAEEGGLLFAYFGYTSCPDICPTTLADLRKAVRTLDEDEAERLRVAFITVDPDRDTADVMTAYIHAFFPDKGLAMRTDDPAELKAAGDAFGAVYSVDIEENGDIYVEHSAWVYVLDDSGRLLVSWPFGLEAEPIANDIEVLLKENNA